MPDVTSPYQPGTPCWVDLAAPDQQAAIDFYASVFGWTGEIGPPETGGYAVCQLKGRPVAGIMAALAMDNQPPPPTVWTTYLAADDADTASEAVSKAGGTILMPVTDVMSLGRMCIAADPTGAVFGVWQAVDFPGAGIVNEHGALIWNELNTTDRSAAAAFYRAALGIENVPLQGADNYYALKVKDRAVGGMQPMSEQMAPDTPSHWLPYFSVADTDRTVAKVTAAGGAALQQPFDMMAGRMAVVTDPQGATFAVITPNPLNQG
ncbi:VOC family protein [Streptomyces sp. NPDC001739]|uniref:VOC family protein n=1 Tax=Streptomyces siderophoricus TaxID=2802281 RepID=A0ABS1MT76_9ACTN|nr:MULTISPECIES: VOC family protein [unclassified Streptomyces]MBL1090977.1 VOC family protein [Streptomyces sp. 9-7]